MPTGPGPAGTSIIMATYSRTVRVDLGTGTITPLSTCFEGNPYLNPVAMPGTRIGMNSVGGLVLDRGRAAMLGGGAIDVTKQDARGASVAVAGLGEVLLFTPRDDNAPLAVRRFGPGLVPETTWKLSGAAYVVGEVDAGVLVVANSASKASGELLVVDPDTGRIVHNLGRSWYGLAMSGSRVVWITRCDKRRSCTVRVAEPNTGAVRDYRVPGVVDPFDLRLTLAPDGRALALAYNDFAGAEHKAFGTAAAPHVLVLSLPDGHRHPVDGISGSLSTGIGMTWTADSRALVLEDAGDGFGHLAVWDRTSGRGVAMGWLVPDDVGDSNLVTVDDTLDAWE